jgi:N-acyl-phosphatidylethanolamine-hydrolysing phospholipase D
MSGRANGAPEMTMPPPHHGPHGFQNPHLSLPAQSHLRRLLRWQLRLGPPDPPAVPPATIPSYRPQITSPDLEKIRHPDPKAIQVSWVGHDTFLIQAAGCALLTDPIFSERASPLAFLGPRRHAPPGLAWQDLPRIDAVLISHNHYDHLDRPTIRRLGARPRYFVPLGLGTWFRDLGLDQVNEMDWWQSASGPIRLTCVPAQHFSMRTPFDRNSTLWCGWVLQTPAGPVYFAGCSGYSPDFQEIGARLGPMRLSLLPIGCYRPRWFMQPMHVNPPEAVKVHQEVRSRQSIGMHWGTFRLTDEPLGEPPLYLKQAVAEAGLPPEDFTVMSLGETRLYY